MTPEEIKNCYLFWIKDYCNNDFTVKGEEILPGGVKLALKKLVELDPMDFRVSHESISDLSQSFFSDDMPAQIKTLLRPYKKVKFI
jgi:hypothetical protein